MKGGDYGQISWNMPLIGSWEVWGFFNSIAYGSRIGKPSDSGPISEVLVLTRPKNEFCQGEKVAEVSDIGQKNTVEGNIWLRLMLDKNPSINFGFLGMYRLAVQFPTVKTEGIPIKSAIPWMPWFTNGQLSGV